MSDAESGDDVPWLSVEEAESWRALMSLTGKLLFVLDTQLRRDSGLSLREYETLAYLAEAPDRTLGMSRLSNVLSISLSRLSHMIKRLERQGFMRREADPSDGRYTNAILTQTGYAKVVAAAPGHVRTVRSVMLDALPAQNWRQLGSDAQRVVERIDAIALGG